MSNLEYCPHWFVEYRAIVPKGSEPDSGNRFANRLRDNIIESNLYLCKRVVGKMKKSMPAHVERDDLESLAAIGLLQAVTRYDHTLGVPFEAFATQRMRSVVMDGIRDADWAPRSLRKKQRDIAKVEERIRNEHRREPSPEEVAAIIATDQFNEAQEEPTQEEFEIAVRAIMADNADTKYQTEIAAHTYIEGNPEALNKPAVVNDAESELIDVLKAVVATTLNSMAVRKAAIIALHYFSEKKLSEIAAALKMSDVKVGALHSEAVLEIWQAIEAAITEGA